MSNALHTEMCVIKLFVSAMMANNRAVVKYYEEFVIVWKNLCYHSVQKNTDSNISCVAQSSQ